MIAASPIGPKYTRAAADTQRGGGNAQRQPQEGKHTLPYHMRMKAIDLAENTTRLNDDSRRNTSNLLSAPPYIYVPEAAVIWAFRLFRAGYSDKATGFIAQAIQNAEHDKKPFKIYKIIIDGLCENEKFLLAEHVLSQAREKYNNDTEFIIQNANILIEWYKHADLVVFLQDTIRSHPKNKNLLYTLANVCVDSGNTESIRLALETYLKDCPNDLKENIQAVSLLSELYLQDNQIESALDAILCYYETSEHKGFAAVQAAKGFKAKGGAFDIVTDFLRCAIDAVPQNTKIQTTLASQLTKKGCPEEALSLLEDPAIPKENKDSAFMNTLASAYWHVPEKEIAIQLLENLTEKGAPDYVTYLLLAGYYNGCSRFEDSVALLERASQLPGLSDNRKTILRSLRDTYGQIGDTAKAKRVSKRIKELNKPANRGRGGRSGKPKAPHSGSRSGGTRAPGL